VVDRAELVSTLREISQAAPFPVVGPSPDGPEQAGALAALETRTLDGEDDWEIF